MKILPTLFHTTLSSLSLTASLFASFQDTFDPGRIEYVQDVILQEQHHLIQLATGGYESDITPPPGLLNYVPLVIQNNTGLTSDRLYVIGKGQTSAATDDYFLQPNLSTGICTLVRADMANSVSPSISVKLSQLPSAGTNAYYLYIPQMISGRLYLSIDRPLYMETYVSDSQQKINDPSQTTIQDPNYYTLYQDLEFTLNSSYELYTNVTNVDYFSLPMTLSSHTFPSGNLYPTLDNLTIVGYPIITSRSNALKNIKNGLSGISEWETLPIPFYTNPYVEQEPATYLRVLAAKLSIPLGQNGVTFKGAANTQSYFTPNYLSSRIRGPSIGQSYMSKLYEFYRSSSLEFKIFPSHLPETTYTLTSDSTAHTLKFTPAAGQPNDPPTRTLNLNNLTTAALFSGAVGDWTTAFNAGGTDPYNTEISKFLSALFSAGFLPHPDFLEQPVVSESSYFSAYRGKYFSNPTGFKHGPWYNYYDSVIHPLLIKTNGYGLGYAYDFDDLLDLAGLIHVVIQTDGVLNPAQPYPVLRVGSVDTTIPNPTANFGPYALQISGGLPTDSHPITIIYSTSQDTAPSETYSLVNATTHTLNGLQNYFQIRFSNIGGSTLTYNVYPKYQLVLPTTNRYNATDVALMNGIVFNTGTNGSTFVISVPNTKDY